MSSPRPTFSNRWDRLTYLLAEYKVLVSGLVVGAGAWAVYASPQLPELPPWVGATALFWVLAGFPMYLAGVKFARWLRHRNMVEVYHVDARDEGGSDDDVKHYAVSPETWADKTVEDTDPYPMNGGSAWGVQDFEFHEDTGKLIVSGVWLAETQDAKLISSRRHVDNIHGWLLGKYRELSAVRDRVSLLGVDVQERVINAAAEAREKGEMLDTTAVKEAVEEATDEVPEPESPPTLAEVDDPVGDLSPSSPDEGERLDSEITADGGER